MSETASILLQFVPLLAITLLANAGERVAAFRWLAYVALFLTSLALVLGGGVVAQVAILAAGNAPGEPGPGFDNPLAGQVIFVTGLVSLLPLVPGTRRMVARWLPIDPGNAVHTVALVFAIYLIGLTGAQFFLDFAQLVAAGAELTPQAAWAQAIGFILLGFLGVGVGIRRSWSETLARLGLTALTRRQVVLALAIMAGLQLFDLAVSYLWYAIDPGSFEELSEINRSLFRSFAGPAGALTIGLSAGFGEEILFRGALQPRFGLWLTTVLFTAGHVQYSLSPALAEIFVIGLVLGIIRQRESTSTAVLIHVIYNALNLLLAPLAPGQ